MLKDKSQSKSKLKDKKVHFDDNQIKEKKNTLSKSLEKQKIKSVKSMNNLNTIQSDLTSRISTASTTKKTSLEDFTIIKLLGKGSYAKVVLSEHNLNGKFYALKMINKNMLNSLDKQHEAHIEKQCLAELRHHNILKLNKTFQDKKNLYFALEYCSNKDLGCLLNKLGKLDYNLSQYFASQILVALSYMHKAGIYHRDLKPENIGIDKYFQLKLFDFATSIKINKYFDKKTMRFIDLNENEKNYIKEKIEKNEIKEDNIIKLDKYNILLLERLFVGTLEYVSPEVLENKYDIIGPSVDIWSFGVILYTFLFGKNPFKAKTQQETMDNIKNVKYSFDEIKDDKNKNYKEAKDLLSKILIKDPAKRLGYNSYDYNEIKNHPFFKGINFDNLENEQGPVLNNIEILEQFGYQIEKIIKEEEIEINLMKELYGEEGEEKEKEKENKENINNIKIINEEKEKEDEDKVILEEKLQKKSPWLHYNTRIVKFFSKGHIDYFEPSTKKLKGSFQINIHCQAILIDEYRFEIQTVKRKYIFKNKIKKVANEWVDKINKYIDDLAIKT